KYHVPTAKHETFTDLKSALTGLNDFARPVVIKANGLQGGKGVVIAQTTPEAEDTITEMFELGEEKLVLEECL
ncbi:phosphoribosylamine--glycine ligase, partial [Roseburia hominis]|nr:phosphoribosylamine--glycine ligase [Roseburia hominis]